MNDEKKVESIIFGLKETVTEKDKEIERLQGENADLNVKNATLEHENSELKQRVSILEADNDDYKNKIAENELVSIDWHYSQVEDLEEEKMRLGNRLSETQYSLSVCQDVNAEQKAEIERLKDENIEERDIHFKNLCGYKDEIARLQKQVDELKAKNEHLDSENTRLICEMDKMLDEGWDIMDEEADGWYKKGGKDTAREILQGLEERKERVKASYGIAESVGVDVAIRAVKEIVKQKGVEVE